MSHFITYQLIPAKCKNHARVEQSEQAGLVKVTLCGYFFFLEKYERRFFCIFKDQTNVYPKWKFNNTVVNNINGYSVKVSIIIQVNLYLLYKHFDEKPNLILLYFCFENYCRYRKVFYKMINKEKKESRMMTLEDFPFQFTPYSLKRDAGR